jgi:hypothetical protein
MTVGRRFAEAFARLILLRYARIAWLRLASASMHFFCSACPNIALGEKNLSTQVLSRLGLSVECSSFFVAWILEDASAGL